MYYDGSSINAIRRHLQQEYNNNPSSKSVYKWIQKYTDEAIKDFKDYHPQVGDTWIADETVLSIGGQNIWMYDIIDRDTRFLLATRFTTSRTTKDAQILMERAERCAGKKPKVVVTDKNNSYLDGIEIAYGADSEHIQSRPFALENNTELIERFHSTLKSRTKTMRDLKSIDTAIQFIEGFLIHYNYLRPHESLDGKTPAEVAKIDYSLKTWADITRNAEPQVKILVTPAVVELVDEREPLVRPIAHRKAKPHRSRHVVHKDIVTSIGMSSLR